MSVAWVAAGVAAVGVGVSASQGAAAASSATAAGRAQQQAALAAQAGQSQQFNRAQGILGPYSREGRNARGSYNALLGIRSSVGGGGGDGQTGEKDWKAYEEQWRPTTVENRTSSFFTYLEQQKAQNPDKPWGQIFYEWSGGRYGEPGTLAAEGRDQTDEELAAARTGAYEAFNQSPYAVAAQTGADAAQRTIMGNAGANARVLSGRTLNATQQNATAYKQNALLSYMDQLNGVAARGFDADSGIVSAGQTFANNSGAAALQGANAQANALNNAAAARSDGWANAAGFIGAAGGLYTGLKKPTTTPTTTAPGSYYGSNGGFWQQNPLVGRYGG